MPSISNEEFLAKRAMDTTGEHAAAANSILYEVACAVDPEFRRNTYTSTGIAYFDSFEASATKEQLDQYIQALRPYAERDFADPRARHLFRYLSMRPIDDLDISYPVDDIDLLKDVPVARRSLHYDAFLVMEAMSAKNVDEVNRFLHLESPNLDTLQIATIREGVKKKFFRKAPELQWLKDSRFRGIDKAIDRALDRIGS